MNIVKETLEGTIKSGQSRATDNIGHTGHKENKQIERIKNQIQHRKLNS
jgi:hypothetical protein